jgi:hypothetical protein
MEISFVFRAPAWTGHRGIATPASQRRVRVSAVGTPKGPLKKTKKTRSKKNNPGKNNRLRYARRLWTCHRMWAPGL